MEHTKNYLPLYAEEITIEQTAAEKIAELREKLKVLQEELIEKEEENVLEIMEKLKSERDDFKRTLEKGFRYNFNVVVDRDHIRVREQTLRNKDYDHEKVHDNYGEEHDDDDYYRDVYSVGRRIIKEIYKKYRDKE